MKIRATLLSLLFISSPSFSGDSEFIAFALKQAHGQGFTGCDTAIREIYKNAGGSDIRINTSRHNDNPKQFTMTSTWGSKGDSVFKNVTLFKVGTQCIYDLTSIVQSSKSCMAYSKEMSMFDYVAETGDYIWMKNKGGVNMLLHPTGSGCTSVFTFDQKF
ncbi:hypothetical protein [Vibrio splendidus]|uniref:hypothetical protein n=1 Tax=Vibrio splendidus TaxID=29497 RepID=UPI00211925B4|nr:hypothetical protein [Vibrio splendidus]MCQ8866362.1 hypothetical protein [Vibrio splendidus]